MQNKKRIGSLLYVLWGIVMAVLCVCALVFRIGLVWPLLWGVLLLLWLFRPSSAAHRATMEDSRKWQTWVALIVAVCTILVCVLPMGIWPLWNGSQPDHRNQYELMAEALLDGRLHIEYGDEEELLALENPYDPDLRVEKGVKYHWDHAFYNGKYYMYFGIVPVLLVFLPYRILTGHSLTTYHGTQLFALAAIAGLFLLFWMLCKRFFKKMPLSIYLFLSVTFSVICLWYAMAEPALYCTATISGVAFQIWSIYFFVRAVWVETKENRQILFAGLGSLCGALVFGCRPPIGLANVLVIPCLITFLKGRKFSWKLLGKLVLAALPYVIVAVGLMLYNYVRFEDPLEFGQAYQITVADQTAYDMRFTKKKLLMIINGTSDMFLEKMNVVSTFPYLFHGGILLKYPIFLCALGALKSCVRCQLRKEKMTGWMITVALAVFLVTAVDCVWAPYIVPRYAVDLFFLLAIGCFASIGFLYNTFTPGRTAKVNFLLTGISIVSMLCSILYYCAKIWPLYPDAIALIGSWLVP